MRGYSLDLRQRIVYAVRDGLTQADVARQFQVSLSTVERYWRLHRQEQPLAPRPIPGSPPRVLPPEQHDVLLRQLEAHPAGPWLNTSRCGVHSTGRYRSLRSGGASNI
ncbi:helix-turn-helix domain-containing protein [Deinococcus sp. HMF7604]|uniref:helix-turn-helix domain-containing protein n=1 Tax=Deinococcus betulae TaxID=2873312 RepID=UPI001CCF938D|nr:helix-turn-helix domain-containing protein [Deinococcus betulae]